MRAGRHGTRQPSYVRCEVGASCVIDPLHDRFGDVQLKARAGAEELDLAEEDLHLRSGVGH